MNRVKWVFGALTGMYFIIGLPSQAQIAGNPVELQNVMACSSILDSTDRLACFDKTVLSLKAAQQSGDVIAISKTQVEEVKKDSFGFNIPSLPKLGGLFGGGSSETETVVLKDGTKVSVQTEAPKSDVLNEVELEIERTKTFGYDKTRFYFTNGQVWEQTDSYKVRVRKPKDGKPNTAVIDKAALGSYLLKVNGRGRAVRVKRLR